MGKKGIRPPRQKGDFIPADRRFDPNPTHKASTGSKDLPHQTHNYALNWLHAKGISEKWSPRERNLAIRFSRHLIERTPLGNMRVPQHIRDAVWEAVNEACSNTGFKLPSPRKPKKRR